MKKLLTLTAVGAIMAASANAATQCVKNVTNQTSCSGGTDYNDSDWTIKCDTDTYRGTYFCSKQGGDYTGEAAENLQQDDGDNPVGFCWCRLLTPAVSKWVFTGWSYEQYCSRNCAFRCLDFEGLAGFSADYAQYGLVYMLDNLLSY